METDASQISNQSNKKSLLFTEKYFSTEEIDGKCKCLLCERRGTPVYIEYRRLDRTSLVKMYKHLKDTHKILLPKQKNVQIETNVSPLHKHYNCKIPLNLALEVAFNLISINYFKHSQYSFSISIPEYFKYSADNVRDGVILHGNRVRKSLIAFLEGDTTLNVADWKLENGEVIYVVSAPKNGDDYYLTGIAAKDVPSAELLAIKLQAIILELADNGVNTISTMTVNDEYLVQACSYLDLPRQNYITHLFESLAEEIFPRSKAQSICSPFHELADKDGISIQIPETGVYYFFILPKILSYILSKPELLDEDTLKFLKYIHPIMTQFMVTFDSLNDYSAISLNTWQFILQIEYVLSKDEALTELFNKYFRSKPTCFDLIKVLVYLTPTYDLQTALDNFNSNFKSEFENMWLKIDYIARCWGIDIPKSLIEVYHKKRQSFGRRLCFKADLFDHKCDDDYHHHKSVNFFLSFESPSLSPLLTLYEKLSSIPFHPLGLDITLAGVSEAVASSSFSASNSFLQSKIILAATERAASALIYDSIDRDPESETYKSVCGVCPLFQPSENSSLEDESKPKTLLNLTASSRDYISESRAKIMTRFRETDEEADKNRKASH